MLQLWFIAKDTANQMPIYNYVYLDKNGNPTGEYVEIMQKITDDPLTHDPETSKPVQRVICAPSVRDSRPAWERCSDVAAHIKRVRPKYVNDREKRIREKFDPRKHG